MILISSALRMNLVSSSYYFSASSIRDFKINYDEAINEALQYHQETEPRPAIVGFGRVGLSFFEEGAIIRDSTGELNLDLQRPLGMVFKDFLFHSGDCNPKEGIYDRLWIRKIVDKQIPYFVAGRGLQTPRRKPFLLSHQKPVFSS